MFAGKQLVAVGLLLVLKVCNVQAGVFDVMEKALMPGDLSASHAKFENSCADCHKLFSKKQQQKLCLNCHDHKNVADDIKNKKGYHGRIPDIESRECRVCHSEHKGRSYSMVLLDKQTFDHERTDFVLRGHHRDIPCKNCHKSKKPYREAPSSCVDCHKDNDPHDGRLGKQCENCHGETQWQDFRFDHSSTKFKLDGKHKGVGCRNCHPQERYSGVPKKCYSCHKRDDKHQGRYGKKCQDCHTLIGWGIQNFNHNKDTDFSLKNLHAKVACQQCHQKNIDEKITREKKKGKFKINCYFCHRLQDEHKGQYGKKCKSCHSTKGWKKLKFDHEKTDFPLKGKHKNVSCNDCHIGNVYKEKLKTNCYVCHRQDDVHNERQGKKCQECHNEKGWQDKVNFDHGLVKFPLLGAHAALACEECHSSGNFKDTKAQCLSCHEGNDVHKRGLGKKCDLCHYAGDWKAWEFDHDKQTDFKLTGKHKGIVCDACHRDPVKKKIDMPSNCLACHLKDDVHDGEFGRRCQRCHGTESFADIRM